MFHHLMRSSVWASVGFAARGFCFRACALKTPEEPLVLTRCLKSAVIREMVLLVMTLAIVTSKFGSLSAPRPQQGPVSNTRSPNHVSERVFVGKPVKTL